jgi:hypothetical protein
MSENRGLIANPGFEGQKVRGVYFFAGNWRYPLPPGAKPFYEYDAGSNIDAFTVHPTDARHLGWSETQANREFALSDMAVAGANTVVMSYWGERGSDRWVYSAPMLTSTYAHDELFQAAENHPLLIMPAIESADATFPKGGNSDSYNFSQDFPGTQANPAPALLTQVLDLVNRYIWDTLNPHWARRWLQLFDRDGIPRYAINIIHVASAQIPSDDDAAFAGGFQWVADRVLAMTGIKVGFTLDILLKGQRLEMPIADRGGWEPWFNIPSDNGTASGAPITALWANESHLDIFAVSGDGTAISLWWDRNQPGGYRPGGYFAIHPETSFAAATPVTALWANEDHLDLFAVDLDGAVRTIWWDRNERGGYRAAGWFPIHPETSFKVTTPITALWANQDHLDLFAVDSNGVVRTIWWERNQPGGYRPQGWIALHSNNIVAPGGHVAAAWSSPDHLDLFAVTADHAVSTIWWERDSGYRAEGWFAIGNERGFKPGARVSALWAPASDFRHLDLFTIDDHGIVRGIWWDKSEPDGYRPEGWFSILGGDIVFPPGAPVTAVWLTRSDLLLLACDKNGVARGANFPFNDQGWHAWFSIRHESQNNPEFQGVPGTPLTALISSDPNHLDVFVANINGGLTSTYHRMTTNDTYVANAGSAGPWLEVTPAVLAIQAFIPEIVTEDDDDAAHYNLKFAFWDAWLPTGIPLFFDVSPGYDAHVVFPGSSSYGNNPDWRERLQNKWSQNFRGMVYNTWNGYTEGYAAMPTLEFHSANWIWIKQLFALR